jgi:hypothetical protein
MKNIGEDGSPTHPSPGDVTVGCIHLPDPQHCHFYYFTGKLEFERPDGSMIVAQWMLLCHECADAVQGQDLGAALDDGRIQIGCDRPWPEDLQVEIRGQLH